MPSFNTHPAWASSVSTCWFLTKQIGDVEFPYYRYNLELTVGRAWMISGLAIRHAMALGLHVRSKAKNLTDFDKEIRYRIWWSLYSLERLLDELTGRPSCVSDRDISAPLPINIEEDQFEQEQQLYFNPNMGDETSLGLSPSQMKSKGAERIRGVTFS